ncbi:MAG: ArsR/SmtB family transcription factor [Mycobacterium leprae]
MGSYSILPPQPAVTYEARLSSLTALLALVPIVPMASRFPGVDPRVEQLARKLTAAEKADLRLTVTVLNRAFGALPTSALVETDAEQFLHALKVAPAVALRDEVLRNFVRAIDDESCEQLLPARRETQPEVLLAQPELLRQLIEATIPPSTADPFPLDTGRGLDLLNRPDELKAVLIGLLTRLWQQLSVGWRQALPVLEQSCTGIRRHFGAGGPAEVFRRITGREFVQYPNADPATVKRLIFVPTPFMGPYVAVIAEAEEGLIQVAYGVGAALPATVEPGDQDVGAWPGGLLPVLTALADEARLQILALMRDQGRACTQEFMRALALSQPATSRHMRLLEATRLVRVERVDGVKWYRIDEERVEQLTRTLRAFLMGEEGSEQ